jgi:Zn-dependent protease with chaperone function
LGGQGLKGDAVIELLVSLLILAVVVYVVYLIINMLTLPPPVKTIVYLIVGLIFLVVLLDRVGLYHLNLS